MRPPAEAAYLAVRALLPLAAAGSDPVEPSAVLNTLRTHLGDDAQAWRALPGEAEFHGVITLLEPLILAASSLPGSPVPGSVRHAFIVLASRRRHVSRAREACIDRLLNACSRAGVTLLLLKGSALAHLLYPSPDLRQMVDIDVLVDPDEVTPAVMAAESAGFVFEKQHPSRFKRNYHHLPPGMAKEAGFPIAVEIHLDTMSPDQPERLSMRSLSGPPRPFRRGAGPDGLALNHTDMLRHITRHAFEPARRIRLVHLLDIWLYQQRFHDEIDWPALRRYHPRLLATMVTARQIFETPGDDTDIGYGMIPLSEIASQVNGSGAKLAAMFAPPAWWLHGFYGVSPNRSLLPTRLVRHPWMITQCLMRRGISYAGGLIRGPEYTALAQHHRAMTGSAE